MQAHLRFDSSTTSRARWPLAVAIGLLAVALHAQAPPFIPGDFQVNAYTTGEQWKPAVASRGDGGFLIVWQSNGQGGPGAGVYGRLYDALGRSGSEFQVSNYLPHGQSSPDVASDAQGNFVVVWTSYAAGAGIFAQRFDSSGAPVGSVIPVNSDTSGTAVAPRVASTPTGEFVVVWNISSQVEGQRFDRTGTRVGGEFPVTSGTSESHFGGHVAAGPFGDFVVSWSSEENSPGAVRQGFAQMFDRSGAKRGDEIPFGSYVFNPPEIAFQGGSAFVAVWGNQYGDGTDYGVRGQGFDGSGQKLGAEFPVNTYTPGMQRRPSVAAGPGGEFLVTWESLESGMPGIYGQQFDRSGARVGTEFAVSADTTGYRASSRASNDGFGYVVTWESESEDGSGRGVFARREDPAPVPSQMDLHSGSGTISNLNGVLEPGETAVFESAWSVGETSLRLDSSVTGSFSNFTGPSGAIYLLPGASAGYGSPPPPLKFASRGSRDCYDFTGNCAIVAVAASGPRPAMHWDASVQEDISVGSGVRGSHSWKIHIGNSFSDVPPSQPFYKKIETLLHAGVSTGCGGTKYCPGDPVRRDQMAIFIARSLAGSADGIPSSGTFEGAGYNCTAGGTSLFLDVAPTDAFCRHVHYLAALGVTTGCQTAHYCPADEITRDAMASFIAKAAVAPEGGAAVPISYTDPGTALSYSCDASSPNIHFTDVPPSNPFCKHIHYLWARGIVSGCTAAAYCPTQLVLRDAMAKFLSNGFGLQLYGP